MTSWCILRCSGQNTLPLARSLAKAGFECWTPVEIVTRRVPRANIKRKVPAAMMPGYLFARSVGLIDLVQLANAPGKEHRDFRVYRENDRFPLIADATLAPLRLEERKTKPKPEPFKPADGVRLTDGAYAGLRGTIVEARGKYATVEIPGFHSPLKVAAFYLLPDSDGSGTRLAA